MVQIKTRVRNEGQSAVTCALFHQHPGSGLVRLSGRRTPVRAWRPTAPEYEFVQQVRIDKAHLWSADDPYLYTVRSTLRDESGIKDVYDTPLGIREAVFDADKDSC